MKGIGMKMTEDNWEVGREKQRVEDRYHVKQTYKYELKQSEGRRADGTLKTKWN